MGYRELDIKISYETQLDRSRLLDDFYIPMLEQTKQYFRIAGFFSSSSLAVASKGIEGLIKNGGFMRLLISPRLSEQDVEVLKNTQYSELPETLSIFKDFDISKFKEMDNLQAFAWLLANKKLEIRIVVDRSSQDSLFHQKVGIGYDANGDMISFSGSINETAQAWLGNIEEFKTFKSWINGQEEYVISDLKKFNEYWNGERNDMAAVFSIPESIKQKIIEVSPGDIGDISIMKRYKDRHKELISEISLYSHQRKAIRMWEENNRRLLIEMATGTGKTRTAIGCMLTLLHNTKPFLVIIATPQNTLSRQWELDIKSLGIESARVNIIDGSNPKWRKHLEICLLDLSSKLVNNAIVYTTHDTAASDDFVRIVKENRSDTKILFICDEVHAIGSSHQQQALLDEYPYRIGLSATPERMFDEGGTELIRKYFGDKSFEFSIKEALGTINPDSGKPFLNPFYYHPIFVDLTDKEYQDYNKLSKRIAVVSSSDEVDEDLLNKLRIRRANILKNAEMKLQKVEDIINELASTSRVQDTLIFATDKQVEPVLSMLARKEISRSKITEEESTSKKVGVRGNTERQELIDQFRERRIQVLIGIKCMDEGIDIKTARIAILMASSTNPREFVQRVGRVIRPCAGKSFSHIYDLIVRPTGGSDADMRILQKEAHRAMQIADNAVNRKDVIELFERNGVLENAD